MPEFPKPESILTRDEAINAIITSIAMEELALSHIINAESEKIKYAAKRVKDGDDCDGMQNLLKINESAACLIERVTDLQIILKNKLRLAIGCLPPCPPCPPPKPPCPCTAEFSAVRNQIWNCGTQIYLEDTSCCDNGVKLAHKNCEKIIHLPSGKKFMIDLEFKLTNKSFCPISIEIELRCGCGVINSKQISDDSGRYKVCLSDIFIWETPESCKSYLTVKLLSQQHVIVSNGRINITESKRGC